MRLAVLRVGTTKNLQLGGTALRGKAATRLQRLAVGRLNTPVGKQEMLQSLVGLWMVSEVLQLPASQMAADKAYLKDRYGSSHDPLSSDQLPDVFPGL